MAASEEDLLDEELVATVLMIFKLAETLFDNQDNSPGQILSVELTWSLLRGQEENQNRQKHV